MRRLIPGVITPFHAELLRDVPAFVDEYDPALAIRLNGGTALSAFYLGHRESEDLDFMLTPAANCRAIGEGLVQKLGGVGIGLQALRGSPGFFEGIASHASHASRGVRIQLVVQSPFLLEPVEPTDRGVRVTAWRDVVAGKLHAVCDRTEPRDFVDLHFILDHLGARGQSSDAGSVLLSLVRDLQAHDPGLSTAAIGRALAAGARADLYDGFPLRMLKPVDFGAVAGTAAWCARMIGEEVADALRERGTGL